MTKVEAAIQRAIVDWFKKTYPEFMLMGTLNENSRHNIEMGVVVGLTDLLIFARKDDILHVFFHELKTKNKNSKLRDTQIKWHKDFYLTKLQASNTCYAVSKGLSEAKKQITNWIDYLRAN